MIHSQKPRRLSTVSSTSVSVQAKKSSQAVNSTNSTNSPTTTGTISSQGISNPEISWLQQPPVRTNIATQQQQYHQTQLSSPRAALSPHRKSSVNGKKVKEDSSSRSDSLKSVDRLELANLDQKSSQNSPSASSASSPQRKSISKSKEDSKIESMETSSSKPSKSKKYKEQQAEVMKTFNELQSYEVKLASQTNETIARMNTLFNITQTLPGKDNDSDEEAFGTIDDVNNNNNSRSNSLSKASLVGVDNKLRRSTSAAKKRITTSNSSSSTSTITTTTTTRPKTLVRLTSSMEISHSNVNSTGMTNSHGNYAANDSTSISRRRTNTSDGIPLLRSSSYGHNRYASDNSGIGLAVTTNSRVDMSEKKPLKETRSAEILAHLMQLHDPKKKKRATLDPSLATKTKFPSDDYSAPLRRRGTIDAKSLPQSSLLANELLDDDELSRMESTPSPLWPGVTRSKTMPIPVPKLPSTPTNSKLPSPNTLRNHSSTGHFPTLSSIKNNNSHVNSSKSSKYEPSVDILSTSAPSVTKRRKSVASGVIQTSPNSSSTSSPKSTSRTTTPTSSLANHRLSHPPPLKLTQLPPPVPLMPPSMLPQPRPRSQQKLHKSEDVPPVPVLPSSIMKDSGSNLSGSDRKSVMITEPPKSGESSPKGKKEKASESQTSTKKSTRKRGTTLPNGAAAPPALKPMILPPLNVPTLPASMNRITAPSKTPTTLDVRTSIKLTTPTSAHTPSFTKIPTPTRSSKSSTGISSPSGLRGLLSNTRISPNNKSTAAESTKNTRVNGTAVNGRKSATTPTQLLAAAQKSTKKAAASLNFLTSKTQSPTKAPSPSTGTNEKPISRPRRLSNTIASIFPNKSSSNDVSNHSSNNSIAKTIASLHSPKSTGSNMSIPRKPRTISGPAIATSVYMGSPLTAKMRFGLPNDSSLSISSSSSGGTPNGHKQGEDEMSTKAQLKGTPPKTPQEALKTYGQYLSLYERTEILDYPNVYFVGPNAQKKAASPELTGCNFGYDDERGDYLVVTGDHLCYRYEILDSLGKGSFGQVLKCHDHCTGEIVAVKIIRNKKRFHCQALVEVKILESLNKWDPDDSHNIIHLTDHFYFRNHLCIAFELLSINLYEFIKTNSFQGFSLGLIKRFCTQLLNSLSLLQKHNIVHCDLKPEHPTKSSIKVIDFGSSCFENEKVYTYIQSRFYRSPEVILGMTYNMAIDMWSLGCILAELYTGYPLFPGENEQEQLACIMEVRGLPDRYLIEKSERKKLFFDSNGNPRPITNSKGKRRRPQSKSLAQALKCQDEVFLDFISRCLQWDPEKRMKPDEGLMHEWITDVKLNRRTLVTPPREDFPSRTTSLTSNSRSSQFSTTSSIHSYHNNNSNDSNTNQSSQSTTSNLAPLQRIPTYPQSRRSLEVASQASTTRGSGIRQFGNSISLASTRNGNENILNTNGYLNQFHNKLNSKIFTKKICKF
ncbi:8536_t:CDS:10 [Ambispora leptoticha]|uniref:dual-specificity kinase n=1 Tax=Ambispora leptoticha TaxID=144679 RepID=A0A9N9F523_9GLOM|nr:8536_t:CDS:10 [Ambispora leptoticha]